MDDTPRHRPGARRVLLARVCSLALAAGLLAGCGNDGGDTDAADPAATPSSASATSDDTASDSATSDDTTSDSATSDDATSDDGGEAAAEEVVITIEDFAYDLPDSVPAGAEITVRNADGVGHTVTADEGEAFDVVVGPGEEVTFTAPSEAGEYPFHCTPHPAMTATLVVEGDGA